MARSAGNRDTLPPRRSVKERLGKRIVDNGYKEECSAKDATRSHHGNGDGAHPTSCIQQTQDDIRRVQLTDRTHFHDLPPNLLARIHEVYKYQRVTRREVDGGNAMCVTETWIFQA
jgi:hypothetical protein